jgi:hypothetical protein
MTHLHDIDQQVENRAEAFAISTAIEHPQLVQDMREFGSIAKVCEHHARQTASRFLHSLVIAGEFEGDAGVDPREALNDRHEQTHRNPDGTSVTVDGDNPTHITRIHDGKLQELDIKYGDDGQVSKIIEAPGETWTKQADGSFTDGHGHTHTEVRAHADGTLEYTEDGIHTTEDIKGRVFKLDTDNDGGLPNQPEQPQPQPRAYPKRG